MRDDDQPPLRRADEADLCRLWATQAFPLHVPLTTTGGERLQVVYPGRRTGTAGPDFQDAIVADASGRLRSGDVELHLHARDWVSHGHRADPAYNAVILHVVLEDDGGPCLRADGTPVPVLPLNRLVEMPLATTTSTPVPDAEPCRVSAAHLTVDVQRLIEIAGRIRLNDKAAALEGQLTVLGREQALFAALLDAAGYSRNRTPCAQLAERLPVEQLQPLLAARDPARAVALATAVLLGLAGLIAADADEALRALWEQHADLWRLPPLAAECWVRSGVRPANRPEARLRGLAHVIARTACEGLASSLLDPLRRSDADGLIARLEVAEPGTSAAYIGRGRALDMAINVVIPFALALARVDGDRELEECAWRLAMALPGSDESEPLRHMRALLDRSGHRLRPYRALQQQGLLQLYRSYCSAHACWECPLATASLV